MPSREAQREFNERLRAGHRDSKEHSISMGCQPEQAQALNAIYKRHGITGAAHDPKTGILHGDPGAMKKVQALRDYTDPL